MSSFTLTHSKSSIDKAGNNLKLQEDRNLSKALSVLSDWRTFHIAPLESFAKTLKTRVKKVSKSNTSIVAQRLKRTPSILQKLQRHSTMRLSTMQDIAGLRAILNSVEEVHSLFELYRITKTKHVLFSVNDYIHKPKDDGYRSVHLIYKIDKSPQIFIEIQLRTHLQHIWATAVEVFGTLKQSSFKSGIGEEKWLELFALLSTIFAIKEKSPKVPTHKDLTNTQILKKTKKLISDLKAIEQLSVYTAVYKITTHHLRPTGRTGHYSLITLNSREGTIEVNTFGVGQLTQATEQYLKLEKKYYDDAGLNVVLVNAGSLKKLEASYPNYFMDTKTLIKYLSQIMLDEFF